MLPKFGVVRAPPYALVVEVGVVVDAVAVLVILDVVVLDCGGGDFMDAYLLT